MTLTLNSISNQVPVALLTHIWLLLGSFCASGGLGLPASGDLCTYHPVCLGCSPLDVPSHLRSQLKRQILAKAFIDHTI